MGWPWILAAILTAWTFTENQKNTRSKFCFSLKFEIQGRGIRMAGKWEFYSKNDQGLLFRDFQAVRSQISTSGQIDPVWQRPYFFFSFHSLTFLGTLFLFWLWKNKDWPIAVFLSTWKMNIFFWKSVFIFSRPPSPGYSFLAKNRLWVKMTQCDNDDDFFFFFIPRPFLELYSYFGDGKKRRLTHRNISQYNYHTIDNLSFIRNAKCCFEWSIRRNVHSAQIFSLYSRVSL